MFVLDGKMFLDKLLFIYYYDLYMNMYFLKIFDKWLLKLKCKKWFKYYEKI